MVTIESLTPASSPATLEAARDLFRAYAGFLRTISACHSFDFERFEQEILDLPQPYTGVNGELLLALADSKPAGCIAFRSLARAAAPPHAEPAIAGRSSTPSLRAEPLTAAPAACELKRLFVLPSHRGQGIAERLILTALDHARAHGFRAAILDTEPSSMQAANLLYRKLGFTAFDAQPASPSQGAIFLRKDLG